jgi:hypothetical protein
VIVSIFVRPDDTKPNSRPPLGAALLLAAGTSLFLFLTRLSEQYGDSLNYAVSIRSGIGLFHPHHLLYNPAVRGLFRLLQAVDGRITAVDAGQVHNIFWAVVAVVALFSLATRWLESWHRGILAALALLVSLGFWEYSTQVQIYVPALAVLSLMVLVLQRASSRGWTARTWFALGFLYVLSMLYHQTNVLFALPLIVFVVLRFGRTALKRILALVIGSGVWIGGIYVGVFLTMEGEKTVPQFLRFVLYYRFHPDPLWGTARNISPEGIGYLLFSQLRDVIPVVDPFQKPALALFGLFLLALFVWHTAALFRRDEKDKPWRGFFLTWLTVHCLFFLWWSPHEKNMFIISLFPLAGLTVLALNDLLRRWSSGKRTAAWKIAAAALLAAVAVYNYATFIHPRQISKGSDYAEAFVLQSCVPAGDVILSSNDVQGNLLYYFPGRVLRLVEIPPMSICRDLPLSAEYDVLKTCSFVLSPSYIYPESRLSVISGYDNPPGWRRYLGWLLDIQEDDRGTALSCRAFAVLSCGRGYLKIGLDRQLLSGWADLLDRLDRLARDSFGMESPVFTRWAQATGAVRGR